MCRALDLPAGIRHGRVEQPLVNIMLYTVVTDVFPPPSSVPSEGGSIVAPHQQAPKLNCQFPGHLTARSLPEARGCSPAPARINFRVDRSTAVPLTVFRIYGAPSVRLAQASRGIRESTTVSRPKTRVFRACPAVCPSLCPKPSTCPFHRLGRLRRLLGGSRYRLGRLRRRQARVSSMLSTL